MGILGYFVLKNNGGPPDGFVSSDNSYLYFETPQYYCSV